MRLCALAKSPCTPVEFLVAVASVTACGTADVPKAPFNARGSGTGYLNGNGTGTGMRRGFFLSVFTIVFTLATFSALAALMAPTLMASEFLAIRNGAVMALTRAALEAFT